MKKVKPHRWEQRRENSAQGAAMENWGGWGGAFDRLYTYQA